MIAQDKHRVFKSLTPRRRALLRFLANYAQEGGFAPCMREMGKEMGLSSSSTVHSHILGLEAGGYISRRPNRPRAYVVTQAGWDALEGKPTTCCPHCGGSGRVA